jgi:opacity protein-like surface antigen
MIQPTRTFHQPQASRNSCHRPRVHRCWLTLFTALAVLGSALIVSTPSLVLGETLLSHPPVRVYRRRPVIVVQQPPPVRRVHVVHTNKRTQPAETTNEWQRLGIGIRANGTTLTGDKLSIDSVENPAMGGLGLQFRSPIDKHWAMELSLDFLQGTDPDKQFTQRTFPLMLSAIFHLFPDSKISPYGLVGAGVHFTELSYLDGKFRHDILEIAGQAGFGIEVKVTDQLALHADLRFLSIYKNLDSQTTISSKCHSSNASGAVGFCEGIQNIDTNERFNLGAQLQAGATYYF